MKWLFVIPWLCFISTVQAQNRVFFTAADIFGIIIKRPVRKITMPWGNRGRFILVQYSDGSKVRFRKKEIWGFEKKDKIILRFADGNTYQVVDTSIIVLYKTYSPHPVYYFSKNLASKVVLLDRKKLLKTLDADKVITAYKKVPMIRNILN